MLDKFNLAFTPRFLCNLFLLELVYKYKSYEEKYFPTYWELNGIFVPLIEDFLLGPLLWHAQRPILNGIIYLFIYSILVVADQTPFL